jgi:hypothetical protein
LFARARFVSELLESGRLLLGLSPGFFLVFPPASWPFPRLVVVAGGLLWVGRLLADGACERALARAALEGRHDAAAGVVAVQQVVFGAEAAGLVPGEPVIGKGLKLEGWDVATAAAARRTVAAAETLGQLSRAPHA